MKIADVVGNPDVVENPDVVGNVAVGSRRIEISNTTHAVLGVIISAQRYAYRIMQRAGRSCRKARTRGSIEF